MNRAAIAKALGSDGGARAESTSGAYISDHFAMVTVDHLRERV